MTFPTKKRINTELFIDRQQGLYKHKGDKERIKKITDLFEYGRTETEEKKMRD